MSDVSDRDRRICEVAISVLDGAPSERLNIVVLNKAMFYSDLVALRDLGHTLSGSEYLALPQGPTIAGYQKHLVRALDRLGWAEQLTAEGAAAKPVRKVALPVEFRFLTEVERHLARRAGEAFAGFTSTSVSAHSHENPGWIAARALAQERNGQSVPINMVLALQQLDEDEEWLSCDFTEDERAALESREAPASF